LKPWIVGLVLGLTATSVVLAQQAPPAGAPPAGGPPRPAGAAAPGGGGGGPQQGRIRPPNISNMPGTDSGFGFPCDQLTTYGEVQPAGWPNVPYGKNAPPPPGPAFKLPDYATPAPAGPNSVLGAAGPGTGADSEGAKSRGLVIPDVPDLPWKFVPGPEAPRGTPGWANTNGVGLLKNGRVIVTQRMPMYQIMEYGQDNKLRRVLNPNLLARPHGMRIDKDDNIWITDQSCNTVVKLNTQGEVLLRIGTNGKTGIWDEAKGERFLSQPTDVAVAPNGDIFVSNGHGQGDPRVFRFDKNGKYITSWSMKREGPTQTIIHTIVVRKNGEVLVGDRELHLIKIYDMNGKFLRQYQLQNLLCGLYIDSKDQLWVTTGMDGMVLRVGWDGKVLGKIGKLGWAKNDFGEAHYMAITPDGKTMYVSDTVNNDITKLELVG
jgi:sugar lactone lactonase YvrE